MAVCACFESTFLQQLSLVNYQKQMEINAARGFPGMFASLDCMHWEWKNGPVAWQGQFQDKDGVRSVILEAIARGVHCTKHVRVYVSAQKGY